MTYTELKKQALGLYPLRKSCVKVAGELGVSPATVWKWTQSIRVELNRGGDKIKGKALKLRRQGMSYAEIGEALGFSAATVHHWLQGRGPRVRREVVRTDCVVGKADITTRLAEIPPDTRDITAVFFGDPLPGRSALDQRHK